MKSAHPFFSISRTKSALTLLHFLFVGLIVFAVFNQVTGATASRTPMPLVYDPGKDILLNSESITDQSSTGIQVVNDEAASMGRAIEFLSGANQQPEAQPDVYVDMRFSAPAGRYMVWLRGKCNINSGYTDSVWLQWDNRIETRSGVRLGNWLDVHSAGVYGWASDSHHPIGIELKHTGDHMIRIQPRQTPHRIDQIWLSRSQHRIPNSNSPINDQK